MRLTLTMLLLPCLTLAYGCGRERSAASAPEPAAEGKTGSEGWAKRDGKTGVAPAPVPAAAPLSPLGYTWDGQYAGYNHECTVAVGVKKVSAALQNLGFELDATQLRVANDTAMVGGINATRIPVEVKLRLMPKGEKKELEFKVKVGATGDRSGAERVLDEIRRELAKK